MKNGKILQWDYDYIVARETADVMGVCLSYHERQILLTLVEYIGWSTRWTSKIGTQVDSDKIAAWRDSVTHRLMFPECDMDCTDVWACILPAGEPIPDDLLDWLLSQLSGNGDVINIINNPPGTVESPIVNSPMYTACDNDLLFGFILQLVRFINTAVTNGYERLESLTDTLEFYQAISDAVPVMTTVTDMVAYMQDSIIEAYLASYDETYEAEIACELRCLALENDCTLTWALLYEYFLARFGAGLANKQVGDLLRFVLGGGWVGAEWCDASFAMFCGIMFYGDVWFGLDLAKIQRWWDTFANDPNSDWETLCDPCAWVVGYQFANNDPIGWTVIDGVWIGTEDTRLWSVNVSGVRNNCKVEREFVTPITNLTKIQADGPKISYYGTHTGAGVDLVVTHAGGTYTDQFLGDPDGTTVDFVLSITLHDVTYISIEVREDSVGDGGSCYFQGVVLTGYDFDMPPEGTG